MDFFLTQGDDSLYMPPVFKIINQNYFHKRLQCYMVCGTLDPLNYTIITQQCGYLFNKQKTPRMWGLNYIINVTSFLYDYL